MKKALRLEGFSVIAFVSMAFCLGEGSIHPGLDNEKSSRLVPAVHYKYSERPHLAKSAALLPLLQVFPH